jgi:hypothetical protein
MWSVWQLRNLADEISAGDSAKISITLNVVPAAIPGPRVGQDIPELVNHFPPRFAAERRPPGGGSKEASPRCRRMTGLAMSGNRNIIERTLILLPATGGCIDRLPPPEIIIPKARGWSIDGDHGVAKGSAGGFLSEYLKIQIRRSLRQHSHGLFSAWS